MSIEILSPQVVDQIAAGEVVERPAHMVKELVENSLDAGATQVHIELGEGGRFVKISDNGAGMSRVDLPKSLERFATSKISKTDDLWKLNTFGFRGEALASISAVSRLTMTSRQNGDEQAAQMISEFGQRSKIESVGGSFGTTILIQDLFSNVPARLKFLKTDAAELAQIKTTLKALALSHYQVEFRVQENGKLIFYYPKAKSRQERAEQVLDVDILYVGEAQRESVKAYAVFADPHHVAKTSKNIWLFAQNRWVQDRSLQAAVMEAYRNLLMHGEFPIAAVWVETDPAEVDVNIHPTKSQVKFADASLAFRAVQASLRDALEKAPWISAVTTSSTSTHTVVQHEKPQSLPVLENLQFTDRQFMVTQYAKKDFSLAEATRLAEQRKEYLQQEPTTAVVDSVANNTYWANLEVLGQANLTYVVCQSREGIVFVDQHAAHERVAFERLMNAWQGGKIDIQEYLFPLAIDLSPEKVEALLTLSSQLEKLGIHIETLGPQTVGVKAAPLILKESVFAGVLEKMANEVIEHGGSFSIEKVVGDVCATLACHSVVRAGQALSTEQMKSLLKEMDEYPLSSFCPHGRPVSVSYPFYRLEKDFGRIV